jgi:hypothetical protein
MDIRKDEGLYFTNASGWCALWRIAERRFLFLSGSFNKDDMFKEELTIEEAFTRWMKVAQPDSGLKRGGKFFTIDELKGAIKAIEANHKAENDPNFLSELHKA